jgi:hypothetical protein
MQLSRRLLLLLFVTVAAMAINAQSIWTLQDPGGGAVRYNPDSAFVYHAEFEDFLAMYAIDGDGNRNILRTDGKSSEWLFVTGKPKNSSFSQFFRVEGDEVFFEMDSVWYLTRNSMTRADGPREIVRESILSLLAKSFIR